MKKGKDVVSVDDLIANRKKAQRTRRLRNFMTGFVFFLFTSSIVTCFYLYFSSPISRVSTYLISGTKILSDDDILALSKSGYETIFFTQNAALLRKNISTEPLIQDVSVRLEGDNVVRIQVVEKTVMAIWMDEGKLVLSDGSILTMKAEYAKAWLQAPGIYGYTDKAALGLLIDAMRGNALEGLGDVSEIHLAPTTFDENYVKIIMQDGNRIFTSLSTLDMLLEYPRIVNALKAENSCIFFDEMTRTAFSQPCVK